MLLRRFEPADLKRVWEINEGEVPAVGRETPDTLAHIAGESMIALVAEGEAGVGGFCFVLPPGANYDSPNYLWFSDRYDDFIYLDRIAIAPPFQRRGWGHAMYEEIERQAKLTRPGATSFALEVNLEPRNEKSLRFHDQLGFVEVGVRAPRPDYAVSMMVKGLDDGQTTQPPR